MALSIIRAAEQPGGLLADRRLYLSADGRVVDHGDPSAAILLAAGPGDEIPTAKARDLGLSIVDGKIVQHAKQDPEPEKAPEASEAPSVKAKGKK